MSKTAHAALAALTFLTAAACVQAQAPAERRPTDQPSTTCSETPGGDRLRFVCPLPEIQFDDPEDNGTTVAEAVRIILKLPEGTALRIAIDQRARVAHVGEPIQGHVVNAVYAFDQPVIPAGTLITGHVTKIVPVPKLERIEAYANGDFSPFRQYEVTFDRLFLPDGRALAIETKVAPGAAEVVHLVSKPEPADEQPNDPPRNGAVRATNAFKQGAKETLQAASDSAHQAAEQMHAPGKWHRVKQFFVSQSPYRRQYVEVGTRFSASLQQELNFGYETQSQEQLSQLGTVPLADTVLHARLLLEVSSATATRGTPVIAELTQPVYSASHQLLLPCGSRLIGQVVEARPARLLRRNGELRVIFEHIEMPGGNLQEVQGTLEGIEVDRAAHLRLDEEGGARATNSKTRYLATGVALALAGVAAHPDLAKTGVDDTTDPAVRASAGASGFGLVGTIIGLASKSNAVSIAFSAYGASASIYTNFLSRGREAVLPKDAPVEIGLGARHPHARKSH
jgi:hypothetical protein